MKMIVKNSQFLFISFRFETQHTLYQTPLLEVGFINML